ncbi:MAG TPA: hypothetical protein VK206_03755 [Anaerolineales bacterium]|nr:hypothetical protein [Anaerolineales bacterium]
MFRFKLTSSMVIFCSLLFKGIGVGVSSSGLAQRKRPPTTYRCGGLAEVYGNRESALEYEDSVMTAIHPASDTCTAFGAAQVKERSQLLPIEQMAVYDL